jgi:hypothetical protein
MHDLMALAQTLKQQVAWRALATRQSHNLYLHPGGCIWTKTGHPMDLQIRGCSVRSVWTGIQSQTCLILFEKIWD